MEHLAGQNAEREGCGSRVSASYCAKVRRGGAQSEDEEEERSEAGCRRALLEKRRHGDEYLFCIVGFVCSRLLCYWCLYQ